MDSREAKSFIEENLQVEEVKRLLVKVVQRPSPQTDQLEEEPQVLAFIREVIKPELEEAGIPSSRIPYS